MKLYPPEEACYGQEKQLVGVLRWLAGTRFAGVLQKKAFILRTS